ncbi:MAG: glycosyltransferase family 39 protein [Myxococcales bacterium]|nr:glycosyltransferase family 39 protein [Myxococcales bacterium]
MTQPNNTRLPTLAWGTLLALAAGLLAWSWQRWPDIQVDFGRELYAPWRLLAGDVLYRDLAWFNGPLSAWFNTACFAVFGPSVLTLALVNFALTLLVCALLVRLMSRFSGPLAGFLSGATFLLIFAFGRYAPYGNYNFITPYSHELTHGAVLTLASLAALSHAPRSPKQVRWAAVAGVLLGLVALTKAEVLLAAGAGVTLRLLLLTDKAIRLRMAAALAAGAAVPIGLAFTALALQLDTSAAIDGVLGSWRYVGRTEVRDLPFYSAMTGLDAPGLHLLQTAVWTAVVGAGMGLVFAVARRLGDAGYEPSFAAENAATIPENQPQSRQIASSQLSNNNGSSIYSKLSQRSLPLVGSGVVLGATLLAMVVQLGGLPQLARPVPVALVALLLLLIRAWWRQRQGPDAGRLADGAAFAMFALILLAKTGLNPRLTHYGFVLAMPAVVFLVAAGVGVLPAGVLPQRLSLAPAGRLLLRSAAIGALMVGVTAHVQVADAWYHGTPPDFSVHKTTVVGAGADSVRARWRGAEMSQALAALQSTLKPNDTVLVLPEGVMLNFWLRRKSPARIINFMPPELLFWGEAPIIDDLNAHPPTVVVVVHKDTSEYGFPRFGRDYGQQIWRWVTARYRPVQTFGALPLTTDRFGIAILRPQQPSAP